MKTHIIDTGFKKLGVSGKCLEWMAKQNGLEVTSMEDADIILASSTWLQDAPKLGKIKKPVIVGGPGCLSPAIYTEYSDFVCVGDGMTVLRHIRRRGLHGLEYLENIAVRGKTGVVVDSGFPWECPPIQQENGAYTIWCGRGCRKK